MGRKPINPDEKQIPITIALKGKYHKTLEIMAENEGISKNQLIAKIVEDYLKK